MTYVSAKIMIKPLSSVIRKARSPRTRAHSGFVSVNRNCRFQSLKLILNAIVSAVRKETAFVSLLLFVLCVSISVCTIPSVTVAGQSPVAAKESTKQIVDSGRQLVFKTIDRMGGNCAMIYGGPSLGSEDFLIQDCGGATWSLKWNYDNGYVKRMSFVNEHLGWWVIGHSLVKVERIEDSLQATVVRNNSDENIDSVFFLDAQFGWLCGSNGLIAKTGDGGVTWQTQVTPTDFSLKDIRFMNALEGWASGSEYQNGRTEGVLLTTKDGGANWTVEAGEAKNLSPVFFTNAWHGCGVDDDESIRCTSDGSTWRKVYSDKHGRRVKSTMFFLNERQGWIGGDGIWATNDGGQTWREQLSLSGTTFNIERLVFTSSQIGWAQSLVGVWRTRDGGAHWLRVSDDWLKRLSSQTSGVAANRFKFKSNGVGPK